MEVEVAGVAANNFFFFLEEATMSLTLQKIIKLNIKRKMRK